MIRSISIQGFKSFAGRVRLEFDGGVTAIVGPNGSGKSNVVEALRWVSHAARARELRAGRQSELIFHGSHLQAPLGLAEVRLDLQLPGGPLSLARRLYRDGSAEQDLAGRAVRARDVQAALRGSGLGPGGLAVIGQGEVSGVVQADPAALLGSLLEAAGLSAALSARDETSARLSEAQGHLDTLQLGLDERAARCERLAREAQDARRARELQLRELTLQDALARARQETLRRELAAARLRETELDAQSRQLAREALAAAEAVEALREALAAAASDRARHAQALQVLTAARERLSQAQALSAHQAAEAGRLATELARLSLPEPAEPAPDLAALDRQLTAARRGTAAAEAQLAAAEVQLSRARQSAAAQLEAQARARAAQDARQAETARLEGLLAGSAAALTVARAAHAAALSEREAAAQALAGLERANDLARREAREHEAALAAQAAARAPLTRERERLDALLSSHARYGEGARNALRSGHPGLIGAVADLLRVPADYETAITAALGRRLEQVVVYSADDARAIIETLRRQGGRATFLPLDLLRPRPRRDGPLRREGAVVGNLADLCPSDPPEVSEALLSDTLLVEDLRAATALAREHPSRPRLVTLDGELIEPGGALTGGRLRDSAQGHLADQRRLSELDAELHALAAGERDRRQALDGIAAARPQQEAGLRAARERLSAAQDAERSAERRLTELDAARRSHAAGLAGLQQPGAAPVPVISTDLSGLEAQLEALRLEAARLREHERGLLQGAAPAREQVAAWQAYRREQARAAEIRVRQTGLEAERAEQAVLSEEAEQALKAAQRELPHFDEARFATLSAERDAAAGRHASLIGQQNRLRSELEGVRLSSARREAALEELPPGALPPGVPREWPAELNRVRAERERLGAVNALAEAEHAGEVAALEALRLDHADASAAVQALRALLADTEQDLQSALGGAFRRVSEAFARYAAELLGGSGELEAERDGAGRLSGLRLAVQPRGKRTRSMNLLSAGERTMAGLAYLFALNHAATDERGLPLAVLDEVDAPLDEANIRRFTHFLDVFAARGTQFLLVTHQKATMEAASTLWGVTTDARGASTVLSIKQAGEVA